MAVGDDGGDLVMLLKNDQLELLALLLRNNEEELIKNIVTSQYDRQDYLTSVNDAYENTISLLSESTDLHDNYATGKEGKDKANIAKDILDYIKYSLNLSMQWIRNCCLRVSCINKIKTHFDSLATELAELEGENLAEVESMAKYVSKFKQCMWEYTSNCRSGSSRALSEAYSKVLKREGIKFPDLVEEHKNKLQYEGEFESLEDAQKLEVYNSIIEESGRPKIPALEMGFAAVGIAVLVVTAGLMVWDIFTAEHKIEAVLRNSLSALSEVGAFAVQVAVEGAVTEAVAQVELGVFIVSLAGFMAGAVAGILFVSASGYLIDLILGSGGNTAPPVTDLKFHTAQMPDGAAYANAIAYDS